MKSELVESGGHRASAHEAAEASAQLAAQDYTSTMAGGAAR
jgi:hypothetical protein